MFRLFRERFVKSLADCAAAGVFYAGIYGIYRIVKDQYDNGYEKGRQDSDTMYEINKKDWESKHEHPQEEAD